MIVYSVQCSHGHVFEEWFANSADYDCKAAAGGIICPECGDHAVSKAVMAPAIGKAAANKPEGCPVGGCQGGCAFANGM